MNWKVKFLFFLFLCFYSSEFIGQVSRRDKRLAFYHKLRVQDSINRVKNRERQLDTTRLKKHKAYYAQNTIYGYYDIIRQFGLGYRHSFNPYFDVNVEAGYIGAYVDLGGVGDFFQKKGFSINLLPKFVIFSVKGLYMGPLISFQHLSYNNQWVEQFPGYSKYYTEYTARSDLKSNGFTFQYCIGTKHNFNHISIETFVSLGTEINYNNRTWYEVNRPFNGHHDNVTFPYSFKETDGEIIGTAGVKIGFNFKPKKITRKQYLNAYVMPRINDLFLSKMYREKKITRQQIKEFVKKKSNAISELNKLYRKHYKVHEILMDDCHKTIDTLNFFIKSNFPTK
ncbi:MAG: hypothetical protein U0W65_10725 [Bacteroidia bacterium]